MSDEQEVYEKTDINQNEPVDNDDWLMPWQKDGKHNVYERNKLYEEVWTNPVVQVAEQYGVSNTAIKKICKALNVPVPPRGYWAKLKAGKKTKKTPLPKAKGHTRFIGTRTSASISKPETAHEPLAYLPEPEKQQVLSATGNIEVPPEGTRLHKKINAYKSAVSNWNKNDRKEEGSQRSYSNYYDEPPFLAGVISKEALPRVYRLLDALYRQVEDLGGTISDDLTLRVRGEYVSLTVIESQTKVEHELTREEAQAIIIYEDEKRRGKWASKPQVRKYDYIFNGRLRISIRENKFFKDTEKVKLEDRLGDILIDLYEESETVRLERIQREEEERKREEKERQREIFREEYNREVENTNALENAALDYEKAQRIRQYIKAVESSYAAEEIDPKTLAWLNWAREKVDWFDPVVAREDKYFGKRHHEDSESRKMLEEKRYYW